MIDNVLVSDEVTDTHFACNLSACKGACCWEGDYGAPLEEGEPEKLERLYHIVADYLPAAGRKEIERQGTSVRNSKTGTVETPLLPHGPCAYMTVDDNGTAKCGIEQAYRDGAIDWPKPISCHLYPIRVKRNAKVGFEALNYDQWDICSAACTKGKKEEIRVYEFARTALVRKYGQAWYDALVAAVERG